MNERTKQVLIVLAGITAAFLVILFAFAVYQGVATVPAELQTAIIGLLVAAIGAGSVYLNTRSNAATRENSDRNAERTQAKVQQVSTDLHNGLREEFGKTAADLVNRQAEVVAAKLAEVGTAAPLQEIAENTSRIAENTEPEGSAV